MYSINDFLVLKPVTINYKKLIDRDSDKFGKINENVYKGILSLIIKKAAYSKGVNDLNFNNPSKKNLALKFRVPVCAKELKTIFNDEYKEGIDFLIKKVIWRENYILNEKCYEYYFNDIHKGKELEIDILINIGEKNKNIIKNLRGEKYLFKQDKDKNKKKFRYLLKFFDPKKLLIDVKSAKTEITQILSQDNVYREYRLNLQKVIDIHNGVYNFSFKPETDARFHNNFNHLNRNLRKYLTYNNKKLVEIDLSNSIPFLLSSILSNNILLDYTSILSPYIKNYSLMIRKSLGSIDIKEIEMFHKNCVNGTIYESFFDDYHQLKIDNNGVEVDGEMHLILKDGSIRKMVKKEFLSMIFSKRTQYLGMQKIFRKKYPQIHNYINNTLKKWKYKRLSHFLFQIESHIMLEKIARGYNQKCNGKIPILTIHDCIVTTEGNEDDLFSYMNNELSKIFKIPPKMEIKKW